MIGRAGRTPGERTNGTTGQMIDYWDTSTRDNRQDARTGNAPLETPDMMTGRTNSAPVQMMGKT